MLPTSFSPLPQREQNNIDLPSQAEQMGTQHHSHKATKLARRFRSNPDQKIPNSQLYALLTHHFSFSTLHFAVKQRRISKEVRIFGLTFIEHSKLFFLR